MKSKIASTVCSAVKLLVEALEPRVLLHAGHVHADPAIGPDEGPYLEAWHAREHELAAQEAAMYGYIAPRAAPAELDAADPSTSGGWGPVLTWPQVAIHSTLLPTGKVFFWDRLGKTLLWDPQTNAVTNPADPGFDIFCVGASMMADGRMFVAGGHIDDGKGLASAAIYDPFTDSWERIANMNAGRWYPSATTLPDGDILVTSGTTETGAWNTLPQVWQEGPDTWRNLSGAVRQQEYYPRTFVLPNGRLIDSGPARANRFLNTAGAGSWTTGPSNKFGYRDYGSAVMYEPGKIMYAGGGSPPTATAEVIDLNQPNAQWRLVGSMSIVRRQTNATILPDGTVLVSGGTSGSGFNNRTTPVYSAELWNPATEQFTTLASMTQPRWYHSTALLLPDGRVMSAGGDDTPTAEVFSPPYLFRGARPTIESAPSRVEWGSSFPVTSPDAASITGVTLVRFGAVTHAHDFDQRFLRLNFTRSGGTLNVTAPANSNVAPPGYYMLFVLNSSGVPSVAKVLRVDVAPPPGGTPVALISTGASWKYLDNGTDAGTAWRNAGFDDSTWKSGRGQLGYGDSDEATVVSFGPSAGNKYVTTYFRKTFNIADPSIFNEIKLRLLRDDGAVVYLNGRAVVSDNMPEGTTTSSTYALTPQDRPDEATFFNFTLPASHLVVGTNVIAVEVHQATPDSSDLSFDLELVAVTGTSVAPPSAPTGLTASALSTSSISLAWSDTSDGESGFRIERSTDPSFAALTTLLVGANATSYLDTGLAQSTTYYYRVFAYNSAGNSAASNPASAQTPAPPPPPPPPGEIRLITAGSSWKYLDNGTNPGAAWQSAGFDDSQWKSGNAQLGYGDNDEATPVSFGPDAANKYATTYFRKVFTVSDPAAFSSLRLRLLRDDGAIVYVNGAIAQRSNMPEGAVGPGTLALVAQDRPDEATFFEFTLSPALLAAGTNVIAVEVHQATFDSSDLSFDLELIASTGGSTAPATLVPPGASWKYLDNGSNQGTAWRAGGFDDSAWKTGAAQLGYGDGDERTLVSFGPNASAKHVTTYFRRTFAVANPSAYTSLTLRVLRDDGAVIYMNGVEVWRTNMPAGTVTYMTLAPLALDTGQESVFVQVNISPAVLRAGDNVVAVEVHQSSSGSSDMSFDLELIGATATTVVGGEQLATGLRAVTPISRSAPPRRPVPLPRAVFSRVAIKPRRVGELVAVWDHD